MKSRMERLLDEETEARQLAASTGDSSPKPVSRTGQASLSASTTSRTGTRSVQDSVEGGSTRVGAKADLVFNMESGTHARAHTYRKSPACILETADIKCLCLYRQYSMYTPCKSALTTV